MLDERNKRDLWVTALEKCGDKARDEDVAAAVACQSQMETRFASVEGVQGYADCDAAYCECSGGEWANRTCSGPRIERCAEDCECMEQCYARLMQCSFEHTVDLYASRSTEENPCDKAKVTQCVRDTKTAFHKECIRGLGLPSAVVTWMSHPVPQGCNAELVCVVCKGCGS